MPAKKKNPAAVALGRKGGKKGGPARAAKLTAAQRSDSARKAVQARWAKAKRGSDDQSRGATVRTNKSQPQREMKEAVVAPPVDTSKKALHLCLTRIKDAKNDDELRRLTEELQRIVFHRQYQNAEN
ncbi:MAG: hypothetical protein ABSB86_10115 [Bryobacteraceae bacterium]|jgi:hypothetical protein